MRLTSNIEEILERGGSAGMCMADMNKTEGVFKWAGRWAERYKLDKQSTEKQADLFAPTSPSTPSEALENKCSTTEESQD
jgi:hypothetical protein